MHASGLVKILASSVLNLCGFILELLTKEVKMLEQGRKTNVNVYSSFISQGQVSCGKVHSEWLQRCGWLPILLREVFWKAIRRYNLVDIRASYY